jgi:WD40 repeat protein
MSVAFSKDSRRIVTASYDHTARVWDLVAPRQARTIGLPDDELRHIQLSADDRSVLVVAGKSARILDIEKGEVITEIIHTSDLHDAKLSPDNRFHRRGDGEQCSCVGSFIRRNRDKVGRPHGHRLWCCI